MFTKFWTGGVRGGSGLGMYLVNGLTRAHGGSITLGDAESGGARVVIEWPAAEAPRPESRRRASPATMRGMQDSRRFLRPGPVDGSGARG